MSIEVFGNNVLVALDYEFAEREKAQREEQQEQFNKFFEQNQSIELDEDAGIGKLSNAPPPPMPALAYDLSSFAVGYVQACGELVKPMDVPTSDNPKRANEMLFMQAYVEACSLVKGFSAPVQKGDKVLFKRYGATPVPLDGCEHLFIVEASNIVARISNEQ
jgi:Chaperonin 10 Kd subunit